MALSRCARYCTNTFSKNKFFIKNISITTRSILFTLFRYRNVEIERMIINKFKKRFSETKLKYMSYGGKVLLGAAILTFSDDNIDETEIEYYKRLFDVKQSDECSQFDENMPKTESLDSLNFDKFTKHIDKSWMELSNSESFKMWRKTPYDTNGISEYTVCGSFDDISARAFQIVQTDVEYRKKWDTNIHELELIQSNAKHDNQTVRWVIKYPTFFKNREYIFVRRVYEDIDKGYSMIISRSLPKQSSDSLCRSENINVTDYKSIMFIKSHGDFDEPGLSYCLIYFDDPQTKIPNSAFSYLSTKQIPEFMEILHKATLKWEKSGYLEEFKLKRRKEKEMNCLLQAQAGILDTQSENKTNEPVQVLSCRYDNDDFFVQLSQKLLASFVAMVNSSRTPENLCILGRNFQYYLGDSFSICSEVES